MKLGVNIDHIATVRQARLANEPDPVQAAVLAELGGADGITVHLRQDRRHIQERDLDLLRQTCKTHLNLEMAASMEMVKIALRAKPDTCTLVPESAEEVSTTGGLDILVMADKLTDAVGHLRAAGIEVSLFVDPILDQVKACHRIGASAIEFNTAAYSESSGPQAQLELEKVIKAVTLASKLNFRVLAGHGLTYHNVQGIASIPLIEELNIGHSIVACAVLVGMKEAVERMKKLINNR